MPLYDFRCEKCSLKFEAYAGMDEKVKACADCDGNANRLITSRIHLDTDYASNALVTDDITGSVMRITSKKQRRELCEKHGVYIKEGKAANATRDRREEMRGIEQRGKKRRFYV